MLTGAPARRMGQNIDFVTRGTTNDEKEDTWHSVELPAAALIDADGRARGRRGAAGSLQRDLGGARGARGLDRYLNAERHDAHAEWRQLLPRCRQGAQERDDRGRGHSLPERQDPQLGGRGPQQRPDNGQTRGDPAPLRLRRGARRHSGTELRRRAHGRERYAGDVSGGSPLRRAALCRGADLGGGQHLRRPGLLHQPDGL